MEASRQSEREEFNMRFEKLMANNKEKKTVPTPGGPEPDGGRDHSPDLLNKSGSDVSVAIIRYNEKNMRESMSPINTPINNKLGTNASVAPTNPQAASYRFSGRDTVETNTSQLTATNLRKYQNV